MLRRARQHHLGVERREHVHCDVVIIAATAAIAGRDINRLVTRRIVQELERRKVGVYLIKCAGDGEMIGVRT